ncbi:hypothetical protein PVK06_047752 [Gossypium arboreum]|uniref:Aminotransferase-like plant mobile domain-containing protein n=1 Tax=Gossypium arboreum TaxID=29729 RepID=A0ABR0ME56_GOSAR|nr:hypothetical protein PVK06_047752 [Gossypium arboreum]
MPYLQLVGFGDIALIRRFDLRADLISALVERWRQETHTLHMSCEKCMITLEDIAMHLGIEVGDHVVMGRNKVLEPSVISNRGLLMLNASSNRVHLMYLPLLKDFNRASTYSRGSTMLAILYRELFRMSKHGVLNFSIVELYNADRIMREFGCKQFMSDVPQRFGDVHSKTKKGKDGVDWAVEHQRYIALWNAQYERWLEMHPCMFDFSHLEEYIQWAPQSNAYHLETGSFSSTYQQLQSPIIFDMFGSTPIDDTMYSTPPQVTFDPVPDLPDVYNTPTPTPSTEAHKLLHLK